MKRLEKKDIFTIPNLLSTFRIILAIIIPIVYYHPRILNKTAWMVGLVMVSGVTDCLDGKIARKFNMISEVGKILDPIADKLTQLVLLICLLSRNPWIKIILILFIIKEVTQGIMGLMVLLRAKENEGAKWYGKLNTVVFYVVVVLLIFLPDMPNRIIDILLLLCGSCMLLALCLYINSFGNILKQNKKNTRF